MMSVPALPLLVSAVAFAWTAGDVRAQGQVPYAITYTTTQFTQATAYNVAPVASSDGNQPAKATGAEINVCSKLPGMLSNSSTLASASIAPSGEGSFIVDLMAFASAKGGKFADCGGACSGSFCAANERSNSTDASAASEVSASFNYKFAKLSGSTTYRFVISPLDVRASQNEFEFAVRRVGQDSIGINPGIPVVLDVKPNEEVILTARVRTEASAPDESRRQIARSTVKVRVEVAPAPILDAAVNEPYILRGTRTSNYPAVGLIVLIDGNGHAGPQCTGTVISKFTILTAAHCIAALNTDELLPNKRLLFVLGDSITSNIRVPIQAIRYPKGGAEDQPFRFFERADWSLEDDVALLYTEADIGVSPIPLHMTPPIVETMQAQQTKLVFVGFGFNQAEVGEGRVDGVKREALIPIANTDNWTFAYSANGVGAGTCRGDSGGPALLKIGDGVELVGVTSYGAQSCQTGRSMRADAYATWIKGKIR